jgi:nucleoside-diphosphate-sugar epimerase
MSCLQPTTVRSPKIHGRVFVTGATGFLGGALVRTLAERGAEVHALARPTADLSGLDALPITWHRGDILSPESLNGCTDAEWVIHAAGRLGEPGVPESVYRELHVDGTRNVLDAARAMKRPPRVLYVSSPGVLGPITGEAAGEDAPLAPSNPYERTKAAAEQLVLEFAKCGLPVTIVRPEFIYGPGDRHVLGLFQAIQRGRFFYLCGGKCSCHPTFIDDAVSGTLACMARGRPGEVYHITGPRPVTFRELGDTIADALGVNRPSLSLPVWLARTGAAALEIAGRLAHKKPPLSRTAVSFFSEDRRFSWDKARNQLGYTPEHDLASGITRTVQWYRQQGWL